MTETRTLLKALLLATLGFGTLLHAADNLKAFPPAEEGMSRHVLQLPPKKNESDYRVQLIVGKTIETDGVNRQFFGGKIEANNIDGWGFTRYLVTDLGPLVGTRMATRPGTPKQRRFVSLGGAPYLIRYSSRVPIVVYTPNDAEVRYRIWSAEPKSHPIPLR